MRTRNAVRVAVAAACALGLVTACSAGTDPNRSGAPSAAVSDPGVSASPPVTTPGSSVDSEGSATALASDEAPATLTSDPLHSVVLTDVATGEELLIGELAAEKPLILETMAIWCSNCRSQQHNVVAAHNQADFHSISLDVDPGEQPDDLAAYAEREGFDWHFAMADAELMSQLRERFGTAVANPPSMPKILFRTDGSVELIGLGQLYSAQQIADAVAG